MMTLSLLAFAAAGLGVVLLLTQRVLVWWQMERARAAPVGPFPPVSVLKPLCGLDDGLADSLAAYARLDYPAEYEVLLGVKDTRDPAYPTAREAADRWPHVFRVVVQRGTVGLNPKVNQLVTLEREARFETLVITDSNARLTPGAIQELAGRLGEAGVGCVSCPVSGGGHRSLGALLDNLHLASAIGAGQLAAEVVTGRGLAVGKAMALRRGTLRRLGGFRAFGDFLAEDYAIAEALRRQLGLSVALARRPVLNHSERRSVGDFVRRYARWAVIHRTAISLPASLAQALLNPIALASIGLALAPSAWALAATGVVIVVKAALDLSTASAMGCLGLSWRAALSVPLKDALLFGTWLHGQLCRTVVWRGTRLRVRSGSLLVPTEPGHGAAAPISTPARAR